MKDEKVVKQKLVSINVLLNTFRTMNPSTVTELIQRVHAGFLTFKEEKQVRRIIFRTKMMCKDVNKLSVWGEEVERDDIIIRCHHLQQTLVSF